ncbi:sodium:proton antiporter [Babesia caballi]|uniref:Sodium:proton antiporter n=1 Tax=Babesia caballi TaxID=5871 RepID=A0AAV4LZ47_BABCB|nr:sodium:proton antiporter [Babesia caballi]
MDPRFVVAVFLALSATLSTAAAFTSDRSGGFPTTMAEDCSYSMSLEASRTPSDASSVSSTAAPTVILGFDVPTVSSLMGAYVCHAVMLNAAFTMLALLSQRLQQLLGIDTGALLMGRLSGLLTVTLGGYTAYKLSEQLLEWLIARLTRNGTIRRGEQLLNILRNRCKRSVAAPLCAMAAVGSAAPSCRAIQGVAKAIAFCMPSISPVAQAKNQVIGTNGDATATVSVPLTSPGPRTQEAAVIAFYCLSTFFLLGGRLCSVETALTPAQTALFHPERHHPPRGLRRTQRVPPR